MRLQRISPSEASLFDAPPASASTAPNASASTPASTPTSTPANPPASQQTSASGEKIVSVSEAARAIQRTLEQRVGAIAIQGEISNFVQHSSGHRYFTLKDAGAQLKAVMWRSTPLRFTPTNGMNVVARGRITMYAPQGAVQLECSAMEPLGVGDLQLAFEALKRTLLERGWFDAARKRLLPAFPRTIGVATSPTGAAIRDILSTLERRMPAAAVVFRPTLVQGDGAAEDVAHAIAELNDYSEQALRQGLPPIDVLIVGRGGGSIEDLWAFNTEVVAEAIVRSALPIISAVGHETDVTIADFVADVRAATPTAAAELAVRDRAEVLRTLAGVEHYLTKTLTTRLADWRREIVRARTHGAFRRIEERIRSAEQIVDDATLRMGSAMQRHLASLRQRSIALEAHLSAVHPLAPLQRGFVLVERAGTLLGADESLHAGETLDLVRQSGRVTVQVLGERQ
jgi:exodeoxyribonuclease VII large subunit